MESEAAVSGKAPSEPERAQSLESNGLKRRLSEDGEQEMKRQRTSPGKNSPNGTEIASSAEATGLRGESRPPTEPSKPERTTGTRDARRKSSFVEEKQRGKRLFGALLGNLNQPSDRISKRRTEIEQRRKAELKKQDDKRIEDRQRRLEKLAEHRRREQEKLDEENMHRRHDDMLNKAQFLLTVAEPRVYYRPWELLPHQEDIIADQIRDARARIDEELVEHEERKQQRAKHDSVNKDSAPIDDATYQSKGAGDEVSDRLAGNIEASPKMVDTDKQNPSESAEAVNAQSGVDHPDGSILKPDDSVISQTAAVSPEKDDMTEKIGTRDESEDDDDHVVEGDEDTVIY